jgi:hypothetical protein
MSDAEQMNVCVRAHVLCMNTQAEHIRRVTEQTRSAGGGHGLGRRVCAPSTTQLL